MKCPKCGYVSHDYLNACRKCSIDLVDFKVQMHLVAIQPGVLDLSMALAGGGTSFATAQDSRLNDESFGAQMLVEIEDSGGDSFDISLDDDLGISSMQSEAFYPKRMDDVEAEGEATAMLEEALNHPESAIVEQPKTPDTGAAGEGPFGPPTTGYSTVMIDMSSMMDGEDDSGDVVGGLPVHVEDAPADQDLTVVDASLDMPAPPSLEIPAIDAEELALMTDEAHDITLLDDTEAMAALDDAEVMSLLHDVDEITVVDNVEATVSMDETVDFDPLESSEPLLESGEYTEEGPLSLTDLTEATLEVDTVEEAVELSASEPGPSFEIPSIELGPEFITADVEEIEADLDPTETERPIQPPQAYGEENEDDLMIDLDEFNLEEDNEF